MATSLGTVYLSGCNYELAYDLLGQNISNNTSTVRLYGILHVTNNYVSWSRGSASVYTSGLLPIGTYYSRGDYTIIYQDFTFNHDNNGNFSAYIGASLSTTFVSGDTGGTLTLPTIPRKATIISAPNFNDESNPTITYSNPAGNNVSYLGACISLNGNSADIPYRAISKTGTSYTFNLTQAERETLINATTTSNSRNVTFFIRTILGGNTYQHTMVRTFSIVNGNPIFSDFDFEDINPTTLALTGDSSINVNGYSKTKVTVTTTNKAEAQKSATMRRYRYINGTDSIEMSYSDENNVSTNIQGTKTGTHNVYAIDSRNNSTLVTKLSSSEINYESIYFDKQNSSVSRDSNQVGGNAILTLNGTFWNDSFGDVSNSIISVTYKFKKTDSTTWIDGTTAITPTITDNKFSFTGQIASDNLDTTWDLEASYNIEITISDELSSDTVSLILNSSIPTISLDKEGVGIMCSYDTSLGGQLQVGGKIVSSSDNIIINGNVATGNSYKTGRMINGKEEYIYYRQINSLPNSSSATYGTPIPLSSIDIVTNIGGTAFRSSDNAWFEMNASRTNVNSNICVIGSSSNNNFAFFVETGTDRTNLKAYVWVTYI